MYKLIACFLTGAMLLAGSAFADQRAADPTAADTNMEILKQKRTNKSRVNPLWLPFADLQTIRQLASTRDRVMRLYTT